MKRYDPSGIAQAEHCLSGNTTCFFRSNKGNNAAVVCDENVDVKIKKRKREKKRGTLIG
jgi:hypothetical protein